jgi:hypothetical protein
MKKPPDCTCGFPEVHSSTATGHRPNCPAHLRWCKDVGLTVRQTNFEAPQKDFGDDGMDDIVVGDPSITDEILEEIGILPRYPHGDPCESDPPVGVVSNLDPEPDPVVCNCASRADGDPADPANWGKPASRPVTLTGHYDDCPAHRVIMGSVTPPAPEPTEDRGTPHWIWHGPTGASFSPFAAADCRTEVSVPIGWSLRPDPREGVILVSTFGAKVDPLAALGLASFGQNGFRIRKSERIGAAHVGV